MVVKDRREWLIVGARYDGDHDKTYVPAELILINFRHRQFRDLEEVGTF